MIRILIFILITLSSTASYSGELEDRAQIEKDTKALFLSANYKELNKIGNTYLKEKSRTSSGLWKLTLYSVGLSSIPNTRVKQPSYWLELKGLASNWIEVDDKASFAHILYADILISEAWMHRGRGWAKDVDEKAWKPFHEKIEETRQYLIANYTISDIDPRWYEKMITIAKAQNWKIKSFYGLLDEALEKHPQYYEIYFRALNFLQPKWHGSADEIEKFARYAIEKSSAYENSGMYARIYWYASQAEYGHELFTDSKARWSDMKLGINDVIATYPDEWNLNNFAVFACLAEDKAMTKKLMDMMKEAPMLDVWKGLDFYDHCKSLS